MKVFTTILDFYCAFYNLTTVFVRLHIPLVGALRALKSSCYEACSSCFLCSITAAPPSPPLLLLPRSRSAPQMWKQPTLPWSPPPTSNGSSWHPSAPWKLLWGHRASTPPLTHHFLPPVHRKWPRTTPSLPALTITGGLHGAWPQPLVQAGARRPLRSARRVWSNSCRRRRASSLLMWWEVEPGCCSCRRGCLASQPGSHHSDLKVLWGLKKHQLFKIN